VCWSSNNSLGSSQRSSKNTADMAPNAQELQERAQRRKRGIDRTPQKQLRAVASSQHFNETSWQQRCAPSAHGNSLCSRTNTAGVEVEQVATLIHFLLST
jgi:hypothetical protein